MGSKLAKSRFTGVLLMLTSALILFSFAELGMRLFYVTTDGFGFTAMNYHWYNNFYWGNENSLGFRDYEPQPDARYRIAVLGDSFAAGHGIDNIDDTFPQMLEAQLGGAADVNLVAESGWDADAFRWRLENYPLSPNLVILSYYLNDIDYLMTAPEINPDANFNFPENPAAKWFILNFFVPNYLYYNLLQFTSPMRTGNHATDLITAHTTDSLWQPHEAVLTDFVTWTQSKGIDVVVLIWPQMVEIDESAPAIARVSDFFEANGAVVVDMSEPLKTLSVRSRIINRFDTHPSIESNRLAADLLYQVLIEEGFIQ
jgi:hypothetical protein